MAQLAGRLIAPFPPRAGRSILETGIARWGKVVREHNIKAE
jgi:hypothetical protein